MQIKQLTLGDFATNCYIVSGASQGRCVLIDPADQGPFVLKTLDSLGLTPEAVLLTHGHYDHILAVPALQKRWPGLPVYCDRRDCPAALTEVDMGVTYPTVSAFANLHDYSGTVTAAGLCFEVLHTPGHTPGSVTLRTGGALFTGDTLFYHDIGRTDFEGGDEAAMLRSLRLLAELPGDYAVYPGHDAPTRLADERAVNPYMRMAVRSGGTA